MVADFTIPASVQVTTLPVSVIDAAGMLPSSAVSSA
jgi:hypothetical protein